MTLWWIYFVPLWLLLQVIGRGGLYIVRRSAAGEITGRLGLAYCFLKDPNANNPKKILQFFKYLFYFYNKVMIQCKVGCQSSGHSPNPKGWLSFKKKKDPPPPALAKMNRQKHFSLAPLFLYLCLVCRCSLHLHPKLLSKILRVALGNGSLALPPLSSMWPISSVWLSSEPPLCTSLWH